MKKCGACIGTALFASIWFLPACAPKDDVKQSEAEIDRFHQRWDQSYFTAIYNDADIDFRAAQAPQLTIAELQHNRNFLGAFKSAAQQSANIVPKESGKEITLEYHSVYERGTAAEMFVFKVAGGKPLLEKYSMSPGK
jgi:hypothetical protein